VQVTSQETGIKYHGFVFVYQRCCQCAEWAEHVSRQIPAARASLELSLWRRCSPAG